MYPAHLFFFCILADLLISQTSAAVHQSLLFTGVLLLLCRRMQVSGMGDFLGELAGMMSQETPTVSYRIHSTEKEIMKFVRAQISVA
jgi:hypothetical protein